MKSDGHHRGPAGTQQHSLLLDRKCAVGLTICALGRRSRDVQAVCVAVRRRRPATSHLDDLADLIPTSETDVEHSEHSRGSARATSRDSPMARPDERARKLRRAGLRRSVVHVLRGCTRESTPCAPTHVHRRYLQRGEQLSLTLCVARTRADAVSAANEREAERRRGPFAKSQESSLRRKHIKVAVKPAAVAAMSAPDLILCAGPVTASK